MPNYNELYLNGTDIPRLGDKALYTNVVNRSHKALTKELLSKYGQARYYSAVDAEIYFGDIYIDDVCTISYGIQQATQPIFGYNSFVWDDIAQGSRVIQGFFTINYTKSSFLFDVLNTLNNVPCGSINNISSGTTEIMNRTTKGPLYNKGFNIVISYGNYKDSENSAIKKNSTMQVIKAVHITSCEQILDVSGGGAAPILERYTFVARDISNEDMIIDTNNIASNDTLASQYQIYQSYYRHNYNLLAEITGETPNESYYLIKLEFVNNYADIEIFNVHLQHKGNLIPLIHYNHKDNSEDYWYGVIYESIHKDYYESLTDINSGSSLETEITVYTKETKDESVATTSYTFIYPIRVIK